MSSKSRSRRGKRTPSRRAAIDRIVRDELAKTARREGIILDMDFYHTWDAACRGDEEVVYMDTDMDTDCGGGAEGVSDLYRNWEDTTSGGSVYGGGVYGGGVYGEAAPSGGSRGKDKGINIDADFFNKWDADCGPEGTRNVLPALIANAAYEAADARAAKLRNLLIGGGGTVGPPVGPTPPLLLPTLAGERTADPLDEKVPEVEPKVPVVGPKVPVVGPKVPESEADNIKLGKHLTTVVGAEILLTFAQLFLTQAEMDTLIKTTWPKIDAAEGLSPESKIGKLSRVLSKASHMVVNDLSAAPPATEVPAPSPVEATPTVPAPSPASEPTEMEVAAGNAANVNSFLTEYDPSTDAEIEDLDAELPVKYDNLSKEIKEKLTERVAPPASEPLPDTPSPLQSEQPVAPPPAKKGTAEKIWNRLSRFWKWAEDKSSSGDKPVRSLAETATPTIKEALANEMDFTRTHAPWSTAFMDLPAVEKVGAFGLAFALGSITGNPIPIFQAIAESVQPYVMNTAAQTALLAVPAFG